MTAKRPGVASSPKAQKYEGQEVVKRPRKRVEDTLYTGREHISKKDWFNAEHQENQMVEDKHFDHGRGRYRNDVPLKGETAWLRGGGEGHRPNMDRGKLDITDRPPKADRGNKASGQDMPKSPFSAAYRRGSGEGF